jgi:pyrimidine deaminase RibD-like protein
MRADEFTSTKFNELDAYLIELCALVIRGQRTDSDEYGMEAAGVLDPDGNFVTGINTRRGDKRAHAERVAMENYLEHFDSIPRNSIIVTTLSPCDKVDDETAQERAGGSCRDLIDKDHIRFVYSGYKDPSQENAQHGFRESFTENARLRELCKQFADTFLDVEQLDELSFMGSQCSSDCSGHRAGYTWAKRHGARPANTASPSFNNGVAIAQAEK